MTDGEDTRGTGTALGGVRRQRTLKRSIPCIRGRGAAIRSPASGFRGRRNIQITRSVQPNKKHFTVRRILGGGSSGSRSTF